MATLEQEIVENSGLIKEFDKDSNGLLLDIVQKDIYVKAIESSVRENFSNLFDAVKEKLIALSIIQGESKIEDHFVEDDRDEAKSSKFDIDYYNALHLAAMENKVKITYTIGDEEGKDYISFEDYGVGLSGERLVGYMKPGYSSKRLSIEMLGKYGLGSKSALANNIPFYVMETWYNGLYTKFMIYDDYYKCITPDENVSSITYIHGFREIDGIKTKATENVRWLNTDRKNGVKVTFEVKKHNRERFMSAVKLQLMYFKKDLIFKVINDALKTESFPDFAADILYETDLFLVSSNSLITVPHILINNVNYGIIDWPELGLNKKYGNIAVKGTTEDVDITASRESVKWTEKTRNFIKNAVTSASEKAGELLREELSNIENPVARYIAANKYTSSESDRDNLIHQLRSFGGSIDLKVEIDPREYINPIVLKDFNNVPKKVQVSELVDVLHRFQINNLTVQESRIRIMNVKYLHDINFSKIAFKVFEDIKQGLRADMAMYLSQIALNSTEFQVATVRNHKAYTPTKFIDFKEKIKIKGKKISDKVYMAKYRSYLDKFEYTDMLQLLMQGIIEKHAFNIDDIDPTEFSKFSKDLALTDNPIVKQNKDDKKDNATSTVYVSKQSQKSIRESQIKILKKEKKLLPYKLCKAETNYDINGNLTVSLYDNPGAFFNSHDVTTADLIDIKGEVIYGFTEDRALIMLVAYLYSAFIRDLKYSDPINTDNEDIIFVMLSKNNEKFFKQIPKSMHIKNYIKTKHEIKDGVLTVDFGGIINSFVTAMYVHSTLLLKSSYQILCDTRFRDNMENDIDISLIPHIVRTSEILDKFPMPSSKYRIEEGEDQAFHNMIKLFSDTFENNTTEVSSFINSLLSLSKIQNLPSEGLPEKEQDMIKSFTGINLSVYDKEFVDALEDELSTYVEVLELAYIKFLVKESSSEMHEDRLHTILDKYIAEKLEN